MHDIESRDQIIEDLSNRVDELETEVERLKDNYVALKDEFNRGAALAQQHCPKPQLGHSVFEGIPLLAAEVERLKAHTWQQERAAVVAWIENKIEHMHPIERLYIGDSYGLTLNRLERGEHWPEDGESK